jgi:queuine tRNA-ribosyltransferase
MNTLEKNPATVFDFTLTSPNTKRYGPRFGNVILKRSDSTHLQISTPNLITTTSRGVVPHISRDHYKLTDAILWINVPFETL